MTRFGADHNNSCSHANERMIVIRIGWHVKDHGGAGGVSLLTGNYAFLDEDIVHRGG